MNPHIAAFLAVFGTVASAASASLHLWGPAILFGIAALLAGSELAERYL